MTARSYEAGNLVTCGIAGLASALFTIAGQAMGARWFVANAYRDLVLDFLIGISFGIAIAAQFVLRRQVDRSWWIGAFLLTSITAYDLAVKATITVFEWLPNAAHGMDSGEPLIVPLPAFAAGGFCGGFVLLTGIVFFFLKQRPMVTVCKQVTMGSIGGALLGMLGWGLGSTVGRVLWLVESSVGLTTGKWIDAWRQGQPTHLSLFVVWQVGFAMVIGLLFQTAEGRPNGRSSVEMGAEHWRAAFSVSLIAAAALFVGERVFVAWSAERRAAQRIGLYRASVSEAPTFENLPALQKLPAEQVLIIEDMGELFAQPTWVHEVPGHPASAGGAPLAPAIEYEVSYRPTATAFSGLVQPGVRVWVQQYPNEAWARYKARYPMGFNPAMDDPKYLVPIVKGENSVLMDTRMRYPDGGGTLSYVWRNANFVIYIQYETREIDEEFLNRYLAKYPSESR